VSLTWQPDRPLDPAPVAWVGRLRALLRGLPLLLLLGGGLLVMLLLRLVERPLRHPRRPWTPWITVAVCRGALRILGLRVRSEGKPMWEAGAVVANHSSWLDILAVNAARPVVFVSKAEVAGWPGIGWLARATGTVFVRREARGETLAQVAAIRGRLERGEAVALFPEGTSTDGRRVLPFKPTLLAGVPPGAPVQPLTLSWGAPEGEDARFYGWFGGQDFGPHALAVLAARRPGGVTLTWHPPIRAEGGDRKALAREAEAMVRAGLR
jgi:1-acyl-sn-glycerol-3-phosphate acyltransferase